MSSLDKIYRYQILQRHNGDLTALRKNGLIMTSHKSIRDLTQSGRGDRTTPYVTSFGHHVL